MTKFSKHLFIAAAALVVAAGAASAQTLNADIPFAFQIAGKTLPAGTYSVGQILSGVYLVRSADGRQSAAALSASQHDPRKEWTDDGHPKLAFACGAGHCALIELWNGGRTAYGFRPPKSVDMGTRIAVVTMRPEGKAD